MKFKQKRSSKPILSDKIADALTVKPAVDIEDDQVFGTRPQTVSRADFSASESEDEAAISDFRKRSVNLLSEINKKYEGQIVSRKDLKDRSSDISEDSDTDNEELQALPANNKNNCPRYSNVAKADNLKTNTEVDDGSDSQSFLSSDEEETDDYSITKEQVSSNTEEDSDEGLGEVEDDGYDISQMSEPMLENFNHIKKQNISEEAKKGNSVRNQLLLWEGLLEMRIHLQRCLTTANQMPMVETYDKLKENKEFDDECNVTKANVANILDRLLMLQSMLFKNFPETKSLSTKQSSKNENNGNAPQESDEEIPSDTEDEEIPSDTEDETQAGKDTLSRQGLNVTVVGKKRKLSDYEKEIDSSHKAFKEFRDTTIQKWNDKTRLATATNIKNAPTNTILQQITYILSDRQKLIRRTQLKRSEYEIVGFKKPECDSKSRDEDEVTTKDRKDCDEYISEIFDDSDFYHQLLRELIECKSADISDPVQLSRQWIALQQMRSKMKRKVDTKATKGRKIKYVVHNQLVNYMAPEKCNTWSDESTNELYSSLFGKMFENNNFGVNGKLENGLKIK